MRLSWRRSSRTEDRIDKWITQQHQRRVLAGETSPSGPCPDEAFLRALGRRSKSITLSDPRVDHAATCPKCMNRLLALRQERQSSRRKLAWALAGSACIILVAGLIAWSRYESQKQQTLAQTQPIPETVDLWNAATYRGQQPGQLQAVLLPATRIHLTIILPHFSLAGQYLVAVTRDQNGNGVVAYGSAATVSSGAQDRVTVDLDLRSAKAGAYFLSTTHEQDQAAYYYPLQIK
jgi:hypothetical protein